MPKASARANARKSAIRARVEHVFAHQKNRFGLFIRTIGLKRAEAKLTLANLAYNMDRLIFHDRRATAVRPECGFRRKKRPATAICGEKSAVSKNHNWPQQGINRELIRVSNWTPVLTLERKGILCSKGHEGYRRSHSVKIIPNRLFR